MQAPELTPVSPKRAALLVATFAGVLAIVVLGTRPVPTALLGLSALERDGGVRMVTADGTVEVREDEAAEVERIVAGGGLTFDEVVDNGAEQLPADRSEREELRDDYGNRRVEYYAIAPTRAELAAKLAGWSPPAGTRVVYKTLERDPYASRKAAGPQVRTYVVRTPSALDASAIGNAEVTYEPNTNRPVVLVDFTRAATERFATLTKRIKGHRLAMVIGDEVVSAPVINDAIRGGRASITMGGYDPETQLREANALVATLRTTTRIGAIGDVREAHYVAPTRAVARAWAVRLAIALAGALLAGVLALFAVRWIAPTRERRTRLVGDTRVWPRVVWTLAAVAVMFVGWNITLPGVNTVEMNHIIARGSGSLLGMFNMAWTPQVSVLALGTAPLIAGFTIVEIVALAVPRWRVLRHAGPEGRRKLGRAVLVVAMIVAAVQAYFLATYLEALSRGGADVIAHPGLATRAMIVLTLVAGTVVIARLVALIGRRGIGNGFAVLIVVSWLIDIPWLRLALAGKDGILAVAFAACLAAIAVATLTSRVGRIPLPSSGTSPFVEGSSIVMLFAQLVSLGVSLAWFARVNAALDNQLSVMLAAIVGFTVLWSFAFARPTLSGASPDEWSRATVATALVFVVCALLGTAGASASRLALGTPVTVFFVTATVLDIYDELRDRRRGLVPVWPLHAPLRVHDVRERLAAAGIDHHVQAFRLRTLLWFFGPHIPMMVLVPPDRADDAVRVIEEIGHAAPAGAVAR